MGTPGPPFGTPLVRSTVRSIVSLVSKVLYTYCNCKYKRLLILRVENHQRDHRGPAQSVCVTIVIIRNWLGNLANFKGTNKDQKIYVGRSTTLHNLLFCAHTLWLNYVTVTFLLVSYSGANYDLLCLMCCSVLSSICFKSAIWSDFEKFYLCYCRYCTHITSDTYAH